MKYYIIAGEASGDLHASNLIKELMRFDKQANIRAWGGDKMKEQGAEIVKHYRDLAFMGFIEVVMNLKTILSNISLCQKDIQVFKPDVIILVDYPGFNLRIAEFAKKNEYKVCYYISPQVWAWKKNRVKKIKQFVDKMFVILPFEKDFYKSWNYDVSFVGHPLLDVINSLETTKSEDFILNNKLEKKPIVAILPGSRKQEISRMLPVMLSIQPNYPDYQFVIAGAPNIDDNYYQTYNNNVKILHGQTYELLQNSTAAIVTSGTATLETALLGTPEVVCYKGNNISYWIAKMLIKVKYISLCNLIIDRKIVTELIQDEFNSELLKKELDVLLNDKEVLKQIKADYQELAELLGNEGASKETATQIYDYINRKK